MANATAISLWCQSASETIGGDLARLRSADVSTANVDNMSVDGPSRRASRGVTSSAGYRCGGQAAWITTRAYDWRNR